mgnify:CR=1 FL=1
MTDFLPLAHTMAEHALDTAYARRLGVNCDELLVSQPDTGEQALEITGYVVGSMPPFGHRQKLRTMVDGAAIKRFMDRVSDHVVVCFDEAYIELRIENLNILNT